MTATEPDAAAGCQYIPENDHDGKQPNKIIKHLCDVYFLGKQWVIMQYEVVPA